MSAGNQGVTESNMMHYLGIVEQRTNEILQMYAAVQLQLSGRDLASPEAQAALAGILGHGPAVPLGAGRVEVVPPAAGEEYDTDEGSEEEEEEEERPLTRDELKLRTLRSLAKREGRIGKDGPDGRRGKPKKGGRA